MGLLVTLRRLGAGSSLCKAAGGRLFDSIVAEDAIRQSTIENSRTLYAFEKVRRRKDHAAAAAMA